MKIAHLFCRQVAVARITPLPAAILRSTVAVDERFGIERAAGGHFLRIQPSKNFHPNDPLLQHGKYRIDFPAEGVIRMSSAESSLFQVVCEYRLRIVPGSDVLELTNTLINTAPYDRLLGIWSITRVRSAGLKRILLPSVREGVAVKKKIARHGNDVEWIDGVDRLELRTSIRPGTPRNYFELQLWGAAPEIVAETETGDRLRITCERDDYLAREEPPLHLFFCDRFCELESHGPTRLLYPGERISLSEQWTP